MSRQAAVPAPLWVPPEAHSRGTGLLYMRTCEAENQRAGNKRNQKREPHLLPDDCQEEL